MRELLLELYLEFGERAIDFSEVEEPYVWDNLGALEIAKYIAWSPSALGKPECYITSKALEYIKNLDNP